MNEEDLPQDQAEDEEEAWTYFCDVCGFDYDVEDPCPWH